ncbi:MAG: helix-hairpin-helix domain-containing protein [Candidatus Nanopelagicaceae bacterium]|jgi:competence protein ComEA
MKLSDLTKEQRRGLVVISITALAFALFSFFSARGEAVPQVVATSPTVASPPALVIFVDITGRVKAPGVYQLPDGSRVIDAVTMAGGFKRGFDASHINLARKLIDGEQVAIKSKKFQPITPPATRKGIFGGSSGYNGMVSVNSGTKAQFDSLPGIGPVLAQRIIDHRTRNGSFATIESIQDVSGIGASIFGQISSRLTL